MADTVTFPRPARYGGGLAAWVLGLLLVRSLDSVADKPAFAILQGITALAALATAIGFLRQQPWTPRVASFFVFLMLTAGVVSFVVFERPLDLISAALLAVVAFASSAVAKAVADQA